MKHLLALIPCLLVLAGCAHRADREGFRSLFNGRDLSGWIAMHGGEWTVEDGVLIGRNGVDWSTDPSRSGSWLSTDREYGDFILDLEYAVNAKGNSGVFLRSSHERNPAFTGHEIQILDDHGLDAPKKWSTGALYDVVAANRVMSRPAGEWNRLRIEARGLRVRAWLNDVEILDHEPVRSARGHLGLQNHDDKSEIRFRNIRIREL